MGEESKEMVIVPPSPEDSALIDHKSKYGRFDAKVYELPNWFGVFVTTQNEIYKDALLASFPSHTFAESWAQQVYGESKQATYQIKEIPTPRPPAPGRATLQEKLLAIKPGLEAVCEAVNEIIGSDPDLVTAQRADLFNMVCDLRPLLVALGGRYRKLVLGHLDFQIACTENKRGLNA